jgi:hypothetical protein
MKSGVLYDDFKNFFGTDQADILIWRAPSTLMNPALTHERLAREKRLDPQRFSREYEAEFSEDVNAFLPSAWVEAAITTGRRERPYLAGPYYVAAIDSSGGGESERHDRFTFTICHAEWIAESYRVVQDVLKGWRRADLENVVLEIVAILEHYRISEVLSDRYAATGCARRSSATPFRLPPWSRTRASLTWRACRCSLRAGSTFSTIPSRPAN